MELSYRAENGVGHLYFPVRNGAMDLYHCKQLLNAYTHATADETTQVIVLWGGRDFFSNGIDLNSIHVQYNPTILAYKNLKAINKIITAILNTTLKMTISALRGPAAAGGVMLALSADLRYGREAIVLNPSYVNMGLSGSEYWSILLPSMVGFGITQKLIYEANPVSCAQAVEWGLIHEEGPMDQKAFEAYITAKAEFIAANNIEARIASKQVINRRLVHEVDQQVLFELSKMKDCCNHEEFKKARTEFVEKICTDRPSWLSLKGQ